MTTDSTNVHSTAEEQDALLIVPEEPETDEDPSSIYGADSAMNTGLSSGTVLLDYNNRVPKSITAIRTAKWMAKAYGYTPRRKSMYFPQEVIQC